MITKPLKPSRNSLARAGWWRSNPAYAAGVVALTVLSAFSKAVNQFRFFIYPDSYYYLLIARNLLTKHHPTGTLGLGGMPFPPPGYAAMKSTFPMLVAAVMSTGLPAEQTGHLVAGAAAVLAVPVAYAATWRLTRSKPAALVASALVTASYGLTYWAGFVMSDSVSVLLGFALLAMVARERSDELSNPGDIGAGVLAAFLLLSRPTYFVALPLVVWMGFSAFQWTWKRTATAAVACALPVAVISAFWFPPPSFSGGVLLKLLPVLIGAGVVALVAVLAMRQRGERAEVPAAWRRATCAAYYVLAATPLVAFAVQRGFLLAGASSPFLALDRFVARDYATVAFLIVGAIGLDVGRRREIGGALLASAVLMLGVYFWVEPRESRYLIHLLPFLVPVAAATVMLPGLVTQSTRAARRSKAGLSSWGRVAAIAAVVALVSAMALQGWRGMSHAEAAFLSTDYPREVAAGIQPAVSTDGVLVTALPWAYHFRVGMPAWAASDASITQFTSYVPAESSVLLLADTSLRYHYPQLAVAVDRRFADREIRSFTVPSEYLYGYASAVDTQPVRLYRLTAAELRSLVTSATPTSESASPPPIR
jgi:general stress protein CsbA